MRTAIRPRGSVIALAGLLCLSIVTVPVSAAADPATSIAPAVVEKGAEGPVVTSAEEALRTDAELLSESTGQSVDDVLKLSRIREQWDAFATQVGFGEKYQDIYIGVEMPSQLSEPITLHLKGQTPAELAKTLTESNLDVTVVDGQPYSDLELTDLQQTIHQTLTSAGYQGLYTAVRLNHSGALLEVGVPTKAEPNLSREQLLDLLGQSLPDEAMRIVELQTDNVPMPQAAIG